MKRRRPAAVAAMPPPAPLSQQERARQRLRDFARFVEGQDPEALAALVTEVDKTLKSCAQVQAWFRKYTAALKSRVVH